MKILTTMLTVVSATLTALVLWSSAHNDQLAGQPYLVINMDTTPRPVQNAEVKTKLEGRFLRASTMPSATVPPSSDPERQISGTRGSDDMILMGQQQGNSQAEQDAIRRNQEELMRAFQ